VKLPLTHTDRPQAQLDSATGDRHKAANISEVKVESDTFCK